LEITPHIFLDSFPSCKFSSDMSSGTFPRGLLAIIRINIITAAAAAAAAADDDDDDDDDVVVI